MYGDVYVEITARQLGAIRSDFEIRSTMFLADFRNRQISQMLPLLSKRKGILKRTVVEATWAEAADHYDQDPMSKRLYKLMEDSIEDLRRVIEEAEATDPFTKFMIPLSQMLWFRPLTEKERATANASAAAFA